VLEAAAARFGLREALPGGAPFPGYASLAIAPWLVAVLGAGAGFLVGYLVLRAAASHR
jgi:hypothetical protein